MTIPLETEPPATPQWPTNEPFTRTRAHELGMTDHVLHGACRRGRLRRLLRGVYADVSLADTLALRAQALRLVVPPDCFVADRTAAWLHGADALAPNEHLTVPTVSVFRRPGFGRLRNQLTTSGERGVRLRDLTVVHDLVATTPLRTALDLGRLQRRDVALAGMDAMARIGAVTTEELLADVERFARMRGVVQLRQLAPLVDGLSGSAGESTLRLRWLDAGLPRPTLQIPVRRPDGRYFYLDMGLPEHRFGAEYDGVDWHSSPAQCRRDRFRRKWLREEEAWTLLVHTREQVYGQQLAMVQLTEAWREHRSRHTWHI